MKPKQPAKYLVISSLIIASGIISMQMTSSKNVSRNYFNHGALGNRVLDSLWEGTNDHFASAGLCDHCHGYDPAGEASVDIFGNDINVVDEWSASMMANAAKDPYWRAKVSHEVLTNPQHQEEIESLCTKCHAPLGNYNAQANGDIHYSIFQMTQDTVALDGVSCLACHQQLPQPEVALHTGQLFFDSDPMVYGPYLGPLVTPMALFSGYTPELGAHINDAKLCAGCHSLVTQTVDLEGTPTGGEFVEQATWHEWLNSQYPAQGTTCQTCHLPAVPKTPVVLAAGYNTPPREPFGLHELVGGNAFMQKLMKDNKDVLGIAAKDAAYDKSIQKTINQLQQHSVLLTVSNENRDEDSIYFNVKLENLGGHKLPSGYPSRRMSVHVKVFDDMNQLIFQSGGFDENFAIYGEDDTWEPHHQFVRSEDDVQIYEMVMGDINGDRTFVLEQGSTQIKDNRLAPKGFSVDHPVYDTTQIVLGIPDPDFNHNPNEGSGTDVTYYRIPTNDYQGPVSVQVEVYYQSVPPNWVNPIFELSSEEIDAFQEMYNGADKSPILMKSAEIAYEEYIGVDETERTFGSIVYLPMSKQLRISSKTSGQIAVYSTNGKLIKTMNCNPGINQFAVSFASGTYIAVLRNESGNAITKKFVIN